MIDAIKQISVQANEASDPVRIMFGIVTSAKPLKISIGQRIMVESGRLFLCSNVIEKETEETFNISTEEASGGISHSHRIYGKKKIIINNGLKEGEKVILLQMQGGQKFLVLDRVVEESDT